MEDGEEYGEEGEEGEVLGAPDVMGALFRRRRRGGGRTVYTKPPLPRAPVQANTARIRSYMGLGVVSWGPADATDKIVIVEPQETFRGERFIAVHSDAGGVSAGIPLLRRIDIGTQPQSPSVEQAAPLDMFRPDATGARLDLQIAFRATKIQITLGITAAPGAGVTKTATMGFFGEWIR
jgi:hypothetical protein